MVCNMLEIRSIAIEKDVNSYGNIQKGYEFNFSEPLLCLRDCFDLKQNLIINWLSRLS